jgi:hypothetical protein
MTWGHTMANIVGICIEGQWLPLHPPPPPPVDQSADSHRQVAVIDDTPKSDIDRVADHLAQVVRLAQALTSDVDRRRARDMLHAASGLLMASTYLPQADQDRFQKALRNGGWFEFLVASLSHDQRDLESDPVSGGEHASFSDMNPGTGSRIYGLLDVVPPRQADTLDDEDEDLGSTPSSSIIIEAVIPSGV